MDRNAKAIRRQATWRAKLTQICELLACDEYAFSAHAVDKLYQNDWTEEDAICAVMSGVLVKWQSDSASVDGKAYVIEGPDRYGNSLETVGKIMLGDGGKYYFFITCY